MTGVAPGQRLGSLDGLRGVAALVVVFHHLALMTPWLPNSLWPQRDSATISVLWRGVTFPLHLVLSAGLEAVFVFFVLSGFVLALPALGARRYSWPQYYVRRVLRLGLPVLGSIALAVVLLLLVPRYPVDRVPVLGRTTDWLSNDNTIVLTPSDVLQTLNVFGPIQPLNNPLWSLGWEFLFSLLLPLAVLIARPLVGRRVAWLVIAGCLVVTTIGSVLGLGAAIYLPIFLVGSVLAALLPRITAVVGTWRTRSGVVLVIAALVLLALPWVASGIDGRLYGLTVGAAIAACAVLVVLAIVLPWLRSALESTVARWLGRISFSLYLVHVPVLVTTAYLLGPDNWPVVVPVALIASLGMGALFWFVVERPSHRLSRWAGNRVGKRPSEVTSAHPA